MGCPSVDNCAMSDPVPTALRGRAAEKAALGSVLAAARDGDGAALILIGSIGTGKSALLAGADDDGLVLLSTSGSAKETHLPYAGLARLLGPVLRHVTTEAKDPARDVEPWTVPAGALSLLRAVSRPVLVVVD